MNKPFKAEFNIKLPLEFADAPAAKVAANAGPIVVNEF